MDERRRDQRISVAHAGKIMLTEWASVGCIIRDISASGARIEFDATIRLPSEIHLHLDFADLTIPATPAWQRQGEAGLRFVGVGTAGPVDNSPRRSMKDAA